MLKKLNKTQNKIKILDRDLKYQKLTGKNKSKRERKQCRKKERHGLPNSMNRLQYKQNRML